MGQIEASHPDKLHSADLQVNGNPDCESRGQTSWSWERFPQSASQEGQRSGRTKSAWRPRPSADRQVCARALLPVGMGCTDLKRFFQSALDVPPLQRPTGITVCSGGPGVFLPLRITALSTRGRGQSSASRVLPRRVASRSALHRRMDSLG